MYLGCLSIPVCFWCHSVRRAGKRIWITLRGNLEMALTSPYSHCLSVPSGGAGGSGSGVLRVVTRLTFVEGAAGTTVVSVEGAAGITGVSVEAAAGTTGFSVEAATGTTGVVSVEAVTGTKGVVFVVFLFQLLAWSLSLFSKSNRRVVGTIIVNVLCRPVNRSTGLEFYLLFM